MYEFAVKLGIRWRRAGAGGFVWVNFLIGIVICLVAYHFTSGCGVCVLLQWNWLLLGVWMMEQSQDPAAGEGGGFRRPGHSWSRHLDSLSSGCCREQPVSVLSATAWQWLLSSGIGLSEAKSGSCLSAGSVGGSSPGAPLPAGPAAPELMLWEAVGVSALISRERWSTQGQLWEGKWEFPFLDLLPLCLRWCLSCSLFLGSDFSEGCYSFISTPTLLWLRLLQCCRNNKRAGTPPLSTQTGRVEPGEGWRL